MHYIRVETSELMKVASRIETAKQDYQRLYINLYTLIDRASSSWQGKDNVAFVNQIKAYEEDFRQIAIIMSQYSDFLKNSALAYESTQDELFHQASNLRS